MGHGVSSSPADLGATFHFNPVTGLLENPGMASGATETKTRFVQSGQGSRLSAVCPFTRAHATFTPLLHVCCKPFVSGEKHVFATVKA